MIDKWHTITMLAACDTLGFHHTYLSSSFMSLFQKSSKLAFSFIEKWPRRVGHVEGKEKKKKKAKAIRPCSELKQKTESHSAILEKHKWELQEVQSEEIERNTVRVWESEKKKNETFFFTQVTYKEDKLVEFLWSFWMLQP